MANGNVKAYGKDFVLLKTKTVGRKGVLNTSSALGGHTRGSVSPVLVYGRRGDFSAFLSERIVLSNRLARMAYYYAFVFKPGPVSCYVAGAVVQYGTGTSGHPAKDAQGRTVYNGSDASHTRLGTYSIDGAPVCTAWPERILELAAERGVAKRDIPEAFPANSRLANVAMMLDARTDYADAMVNRVFGAIESDTHKAMRVMAPSHVPADAGALVGDLDRLNARFAPIVAKMMVRYARRRLRELQTAPQREAMQDPSRTAGPSVMFASEGDLLRAIIDELDDRHSETWRAIEHAQRLARNDTRDEVEEAVAARAEVKGRAAIERL